MKHVLLVVLVLLYVVVIGQNWGVYAAALMFATIVRDIREPLRSPVHSPSLTLYSPEPVRR